MSHAKHLLPLALLAGCVPALTLGEEPDDSQIAEDESRTVELRYLRFDAKGFEQTLTKADIKKNFPEKILRETWLLDMDIRPLITNALNILVQTDEVEAYGLDPAARNMWKLLNMTPANTVLTGSSLAGLLGIGEAVGLPPSLVLSDLIGIEANTGIISVESTVDPIIDQVVLTHPNAQLRRAPKFSTCPDGQPAVTSKDGATATCKVTPGGMPVSLWDVVTDFQDLATTFGPAAFPDASKAPHPGFISAASPIVAAQGDFSMTVRVNLNALPYKGVDLTSVTVASVNSTSSQVAEAFDFDSPDWMEIKGLAPNLVIDSMTMKITENPERVASGTQQDPMPLGDSPVWDLPLWQFERLIAQIAYLRAQEIEPHCSVYAPQGDVEEPFEAVHVCMGDNGVADDGEEPDAWVSLSVDESVLLDEPPPPPSYFWDVLLEVAQLRLHDEGLAEGEADIGFTLRDVAAGISTAELEGQIRDNIQKNPAALAAIAELLNENTDGAADFYYYVDKTGGDWLYFITEDDIKGDNNGGYERRYADYKNVGFFSDAQGKTKISSRENVDGDVTHEKIAINPGDTLYTQDDEGNVYRVDVNDKPERHKVSLTITRTH